MRTDERTPPRPQVKICGLTRNEDAVFAESAGAQFVGVVLSAGFGRSVPEGRAPGVVRGVAVHRVAVLVDEAPSGAARLAESLGASVVQLHGDEPPTTLEALRSLGPWTLWKAVRAESIDDVARAVETYGAVADGLLVEGFSPGIVGGGGARLALEPDEVRAAIPDGVDFILAGGLTPDSVGRAVARFAPDVVDVSSGVERTVGTKDPLAVEAFVRAARFELPPQPDARES